MVVECWAWAGDDGTAFPGVSCVLWMRMAKGMVHWAAFGSRWVTSGS